MTALRFSKISDQFCLFVCFSGNKCSKEGPVLKVPPSLLCCFLLWLSLLQPLLSYTLDLGEKASDSINYLHYLLFYSCELQGYWEWPRGKSIVKKRNRAFLKMGFTLHLPLNPENKSTFESLYKHYGNISFFKSDFGKKSINFYINHQSFGLI